MKKILYLSLISIIGLSALSLSANIAKATSYLMPNYSAYFESGNSNSMRVNISGAPSYSQVDIYVKQNSNLWSGILNVGYTDQYGNFNGLVNNPGVYSTSSVESYAVVAGQTSNTVTVGYNNQCSYNNCNYGYLNPSTTSVSIQSGGSTNVYFNSNYYQNLYISQNPNSNIASASLSGNQLYIYGYNSGSTNVRVCDYQSQSCASIQITVNGYNYNSGLVVSPSFLTLAVGETRTVSTTVNGYSVNSYVSSGNSNLITVTNYNTGLTIKGVNPGTTTLTVCSYSYNNACGTLTVTVQGYVYGTSTYKNGTLVAQNNTIYQIYRNRKIGFTNLQAFRDLGFKLDNVLFVDNLSNIADQGQVISTSYSAHPWGSWIKWGQTVYFVHENGLIPIASYDVFLNNGGDNRNILQANSWDAGLPLLPLMGFNDYRLQ